MSLELNIIDGKYKFSGRSLSPSIEKNSLLKPYHKQLCCYGVKLCLLPTNEQKEKLNQQIGNARFVRNQYLSSRIEVYKSSKITLTVSEYKKSYLPKLKEENTFLYESDKFALENAIIHVDNAYNKFFDNIKKGRKVGKGNTYGFPKFASKYKPSGNRYTTNFTNNNIEILLIDDIPYIKLPKVGKIRFILPKGKVLEDIVPSDSRITSVSVQKDGNNYNVSIQLETIIDEIKPISYTTTLIHKSSIISMDMGIKSFGVYGNDSFTKEIKNPKWINLHQKRLRRFQKALSRKQYNSKEHKGSKNYYKAKEKVAKEHRKIRNQRLDFQHKLSREIVNNCNVFICEDLNIKGMVSNHKLAKEIASCGWAQFLTFVKYKLEKKGGIFLKVDKYFPSSKLCYICGHKNNDLMLKDRTWECPHCHSQLDRDENAKNNLFKEGLRLLKEKYNLDIA